jgi:protein phosphatase
MRPAQWRLDFDNGSSVAVRGTGLIGRAPVAARGDNVEQLVAVADDTCSVSRTHLQFGIDRDGLWVRDMSSTNGSDIEVDGRRTPLVPGSRMTMPSGSRIHMGDHRALSVYNGLTAAELRLDWGFATRAGTSGRPNQDAHGAAPPVFVVADGMGGHSAGELASRAAIEAMSELAGPGPVTVDMLKDCLADARARIARIPTSPGKPPGTTLSGVIVTELDGAPSWWVVNIGDSRTYLLDTDGVQQLTVDHSMVRELIRAGVITQSSASSHPMRHLITRALLAEVHHPADIWLRPIRAGDRLLVCTDGLTKAVDDTAIAEVLRASADPRTAAAELVRVAVDADHHDDVTALIVDAEF